MLATNDGLDAHPNGLAIREMQTGRLRPCPCGPPHDTALSDRRSCALWEASLVLLSGRVEDTADTSARYMFGPFTRNSSHTVRGRQSVVGGIASRGIGPPRLTEQSGLREVAIFVGMPNANSGAEPEEVAVEAITQLEEPKPEAVAKPPEAEEEKKEPECAFCAYMEAGPCGEVFRKWDECVQKAKLCPLVFTKTALYCWMNSTVGLALQAGRRLYRAVPRSNQGSLGMHAEAHGVL
eukprot:scaffold1558_cov403-Prasinococcus_capsulatus_cf.AAC.25